MSYAGIKMLISSQSHSEGIARIYQRDAQRYGFVPHPLPPSGIEPDPSKKEYCTHWFRTGVCAFMSQGCLFKHEMPLPHKLREIGFRETPRWWKEKSVQLQAPTWMERRLTEQNGDEYEDVLYQNSVSPLVVMSHSMLCSHPLPSSSSG